MPDIFLLKPLSEELEVTLNDLISQYKEALDKYGKLEYDECFGYTHILAMGGKESVENLKKVKIKEHIALISNFISEI